jgi:hypothetical protein
MPYSSSSILCLLAMVLLLPGCLFYDEAPENGSTLDGPFEYRLSGEFNDNITTESFQTGVEWRPESGDMVKAIFFASKQETVNGKEINQTFKLTIERYREWPRGGNFGVTTNSNLSAADDGRLHATLYSEYREKNIHPEGEEDFLHIDVDFTVTDGNFYITASDDEVLRGDFELFFRMDRKHTRDPEEEGIIGPVENALMIQGGFDINLQETRVNNFSY